MLKNFTKAFIIFGALMFLKGIASGNRVEVHIIVKRYLFPAHVLGKRPTQSTIIRLKGSSIAGIGVKGATGGF